MNPLKKLLEESHKDLHQWFLIYQECILLQWEKEALEALDAFYHVLHTHLSFENTHLLVGDDQFCRWKHKVYTQEHSSLINKLERLIAHTKSYVLLEGRRQRLAMINLIEEQQRFYHLLEHHEEREEQDLFLNLPMISLDLWRIPYREVVDKFYDFKQNVVHKLSTA